MLSDGIDKSIIIYEKNIVWYIFRNAERMARGMIKKEGKTCKRNETLEKL